MVDVPWHEHAVATRLDSDGFRSIVIEGNLRQVVEQIAQNYVPYGDMRISLPDRRQVPTTWVGEQISTLVRAFRLLQPSPPDDGLRL